MRRRVAAEIETPATIPEFLGGAPVSTRHDRLATRRVGDRRAKPEPFELSLVGSLQTERRHPRECFEEFQTRHGRRPHSAAVWIGPEGDFTLEELKAIQDSGAQPISLGKLVLRVETAAVYCLSILNYELQRQAATQ